MAITNKYNILGTVLEYPIKLSRDDAREALARILLGEGPGWFTRTWTCSMYTDPDNMTPEDYTLHILYHFRLLDAQRRSDIMFNTDTVAFRINQRGLDFLKEDA